MVHVVVEETAMAEETVSEEEAAGLPVTKAGLVPTRAVRTARPTTTTILM